MLKRLNLIITIVIVAALPVIVIFGFLLFRGQLPFFKTANQKTEITYWGLWEEEVMKPVLDDFQKINPNISVTYSRKFKEDYFSLLKNKINSKDAPDIFWFNSSWFPIFKGFLSSVPRSVYSKEEYEKIFYPVTEQLLVSGEYKGIPIELSNLVLVTNTKYLRNAKFSSSPTSWLELRYQYTPSLTVWSKGRVTRSAVALGTSSNVNNAAAILATLMMQEGVKFTSDNKVTFDKSETFDGNNLGADALTFYTSFAGENGTWNETFPDSITTFKKGLVAMIFLTSEELRTLVNEKSLSFTVSPVPQVPTKKKVVFGTFWANGINNSSEQKEAAWELAKFLSKKEVLEKVFTNEQRIQGLGRPYPRIDMKEKLSLDKFFAAVVDQGELTQSWYLDEDSAEGSLNLPMVKIFKDAIDNVGRSSSAVGAIHSSAEEAQKLMDSVTGVQPNQN